MRPLKCVSDVWLLYVVVDLEICWLFISDLSNMAILLCSIYYHVCIKNFISFLYILQYVFQWSNKRSIFILIWQLINFLLVWDKFALYFTFFYLHCSYHFNLGLIQIFFEFSFHSQFINRFLSHSCMTVKSELNCSNSSKVHIISGSLSSSSLLSSFKVFIQIQFQL